MGPPEGLLQARVPIYGKLRFKNERGVDVEKGINVGDEWMYRSFIEGGGRAAAIWTFEGINGVAEFPDGLPVEMTIEVFRTYKGDLENGIPGSLLVRNPDSGEKPVEVRIFVAKKFATDVQFIPRSFTGSDGKSRSICSATSSTTGSWRSWLQCLPPAQYFGMAQADLYLRRPQNSSFCAELRQGLPGHLAADGAGDRPGGDVQHVPQRAGGAAGHAGRVRGGLLRAASWPRWLPAS